MAGIYIHVPFCKTRCIYCDFFTRTNMAPKASYVDALCKEMQLRKDYIKAEKVSTIYFGGGTPSQLSYTDFQQIFESLYKTFEVEEDAEITIEANPDDLSSQYLKDLSSLPFNRLSMGIQSFDDGELNFLKRRHSSLKAKEAVRLSKEAGFANISIDLMYGLPKQTMEIWQNNLEQAIFLDIQHISSYHLIYEQGTRLYKLFKHGDVKPVDEDISVDMFSLMIDKLGGAGFEHYEISNFARNGRYSKHNSSYWLGARYLGLGPAAHSFDGENRAWNISSIPKYTEGIDNGRPETEIEYLDLYTRYNDFVLTRMRTMWGINLVELEAQFGLELKNYCLRNASKYLDKGCVVNENNVLKLSRNGIFISDAIMSDLMWVD